MTVIPCIWDGESFTPARGFQKLADQNFTIGERYVLEPTEERSAKTHRHYFAAIRDAWSNLPETHADRFATPDHLRKHALISTGYRDERTLVASSKAEALRLAAFIRPVDEFAVVVVRDSVVIQWTARSQNMRAMDRKTFGESKQAVLDYCAGLIGVEPETLESEAGKAA